MWKKRCMTEIKTISVYKKILFIRNMKKKYNTKMLRSFTQLYLFNANIYFKIAEAATPLRRFNPRNRVIWLINLLIRMPSPLHKLTHRWSLYPR